MGTKYSFNQDGSTSISKENEDETKPEKKVRVSGKKVKTERQVEKEFQDKDDNEEHSLLSAFLAILLFMGLIFLVSYIFALLWNTLFITLINILNPIDYWQSFWIIFVLFVIKELKFDALKKYIVEKIYS